MELGRSFQGPWMRLRLVDSVFHFTRALRPADVVQNIQDIHGSWVSSNFVYRRRRQLLTSYSRRCVCVCVSFSFLSSLYYWHAPICFWRTFSCNKMCRDSKCLSTFIYLYLPELVCVCVCVRLATRCVVLHVLGVCTNASFHFTAKRSLIGHGAGSPLRAFVNVNGCSEGRALPSGIMKQTTHAPQK